MGKQWYWARRAAGAWTPSLGGCPLLSYIAVHDQPLEDHLTPGFFVQVADQMRVLVSPLKSEMHTCKSAIVVLHQLIFKVSLMLFLSYHMFRNRAHSWYCFPAGWWPLPSLIKVSSLP